MGKLNGLFVCVLLLTVTGCNVFRDTTNDRIADGQYRSSAFDTKKVYVKNAGDSTSLIVYKLEKVENCYQACTGVQQVKTFLPTSRSSIPLQKFNAFTFDLDALTIPFKYRPSSSPLPQQFTTSLNGAVFVGFRNDNYKISYKKDFFKYYQRHISHYAISFGGFTGFGSTAMNPWVTDYNINVEYEGVVWLKGAAVIMAVGKFTSGVSVGWDNLLDRNSKFWIYENRPWVGLVFGLNLN